MNINAADLAESTQLSQLRNTLAANQGPAIVHALNEKARLNTIQQGRSVSMKNLSQFSRAKGTTPDLGSSHIRVTDPDGETEDFVLTLRRYHQNAQKVAAKGKSTKLKSGTTYLAYSPDRFYLQDDENGNEQWPVTFPAVAMDDSTDKITVTFNKDGFVSSSPSGKTKAKGNVGVPQSCIGRGYASDCS